MREAQDQGKRPVNRPRSWNQGVRDEDKWRKKTTWFRQGGYTTVMFCPYTPNSVLANKWKEAEAGGGDTKLWSWGDGASG